MKINKMSEYKNEYLEIETPPEISNAIMTGIERGKKKMTRNNNSRSKVLKVCASMVLATSILTGAINVSPTFAEILKNIPIIGEIVKVLQFTDGEAEGGIITDGTDISGIEIVEEETFEEIVIEFSNDGENQDTVGAYKVTQAEYPSTITFEIGGARRFTAMEDFKKLNDSQYVKDIYPLITLDDSMIRFVVVFNTAVNCEITELKSPASLVMRISEKELSDQQDMYIVRTESMQNGETFGIQEEEFAREYDTRILKDDNGWFIIELNTYDSKEAAEAFIAEYSVSSDKKLIVEKRSEKETPKHYPSVLN
ncbi:MAG: hypothetical protein JEZ08_08030 [Clostridiales bacterium]|nr:hypothetical protein [Clostridiales bacterium]